MPATIKSFDVAKQTVTVQIAINDEARKNGVATTIPIKVLVDIPIMLYGSGNFTITVPVQAGDECLVVFADRSIDAWFQSGGQQNQAAPRAHSLADGVAILGLRNQTRKLAAYSADTLQIRSEDGATMIEVADTAVSVKATTFTVQAETVNITASNTATINSQGNLNVTANGQVDIESASINTKIDQRIYRTHEHSGVTTGGGVSGPVL